MHIPYSPPRVAPTETPDEVITLSSDEEKEDIPLRLEPDMCTFNEEGVRAIFRQIQGPYFDRIMGTPSTTTPPFCNNRGLPSADLRESLPTIVLHELLTVPAVRLWAINEVGTTFSTVPGETVVPVELAALVGYVLTTGVESALVFQIFELSERLMGCEMPYRPLKHAVRDELPQFLQYLEDLKHHLKELKANNPDYDLSNFPSYNDNRLQHAHTAPTLWLSDDDGGRTDYMLWKRLLNTEDTTQLRRPYTNFNINNNCNDVVPVKWNFYVRHFITFKGVSDQYLINNKAGQIILDTILSDDIIRRWYERSLSTKYRIGRVGKNPIPQELAIYVAWILSGNIRVLGCIPKIKIPPFGLLSRSPEVVNNMEFYLYLQYLMLCYSDLTNDSQVVEYGMLPPFGLWVQHREKHFRTLEPYL